MCSIAAGTLDRFRKSSVCMSVEKKFGALRHSLLKNISLLGLGINLERADGRSTSSVSRAFACPMRQN